MQVTAEHIRYARASQLAILLGRAPSEISQWSNGRMAMSGQVLARLAEQLKVKKSVVLEGFDARRADFETALRYREEVDEYLASSAFRKTEPIAS